MFAIYAVVICAVFFGGVFHLLWSNRKLFAFSGKLSGPFALPIIGNGLLFNCKSEDIYDVLLRTIRGYKSPMRFWLGPKLIAVFSQLNHVEKILSSTKITYKGEIYKFIASIAGIGLITGSGPRWKEHRKLIQPMVNLKFVAAQLEVIQKHSRKLMKELQKHVDTGYLDIQQPLHPCCFDIIGESVCGVETNTQEGQNMKVLHYFEDFYDNIFTQMVKPWLHPNLFFNMTHYKQERNAIKKGMSEFFKEVVEKSRKRLRNTDTEVTYFSPMVDNIISHLDANPNIMNDEELFQHLVTLYAASEDTATLVVAALCLCFGMYPEYQEIAANEIRDVFGETPRDVTEEDIPKLKYLEMCIKEALRLFPIGPFILRKCTEELCIGDYTIPVGCEVLIPIDVLHRDPEQWSNPEHFHPDHFLQENVKNRHMYAFIPFSIGPRVCIGKYLAMQMLKVISANMLQHFAFEARGKYPDLKFRTDISVRVKTGYNVKISKRTWK